MIWGRLAPPLLLAAAVALVPGAPALAVSPALEAASSLTLEWTAPGDDGRSGAASAYDLRYALEHISEASFAAATPVANLPRPSGAGRKERVEVGGLIPETRYYFALKTVDEVGNWSPLSNVVLRTAPDPSRQVPAAVSLTPPQPNPARGHAAFRLSLSREADVLIGVFDAAGRWVRTIARRHCRAGITDFDWRLQDGNLLPLGSGLYWIRAVVGEVTVARQLVVVR